MYDCSHKLMLKVISSICKNSLKKIRNVIWNELKPYWFIYCSLWKYVVLLFGHAEYAIKIQTKLYLLCVLWWCEKEPKLICSATCLYFILDSSTYVASTTLYLQKLVLIEDNNKKLTTWRIPSERVFLWLLTLHACVQASSIRSASMFGVAIGTFAKRRSLE